MKHRHLIGFLAAAIVIFLLTGPAAAVQRVYIDINQPFAERIPVAIPDFLPITPGQTGPEEVSVDLPKRLGDNLDLTGYFILVDKRTFLEANPRAGVDSGVEIEYKEWRAIGSELLVKGAYALSGDQLTLELRLFDVAEGKNVLGKRYTGALKDGRKMINRFTNEILYVITGEYGVFGTKIAFVAGARANKRIMITEFGSDEVAQVSNENGPATMPAVSPSGEIAYCVRVGNQWQLRSGGKVMGQGPQFLSPTFTPGGGLLAAVGGRQDTNIFMFSSPGAAPTPVTKGWGMNFSPTVSPDGSQMAFVSNRAGGAQIYVMPLGGGEPRRLTMDGSQNTDPRWSPRGDRIIYVGDGKDIFSIAPDGSDLRQLTSGAGSNTGPTWSPDGRLIAFASTRLGGSQLFIMTAAGERQRPLMPDYKGGARYPYWSPAKPER